MTMAVILSLIFGALPLVGLILWGWNEFRYVLPQKVNSKLKVPPGYMGFPIFGELFTFLWYFKFLRRPDEFINDKRRKYGEGVGMYRTYLFGSPAIIVCSPSAHTFVFRSDENFNKVWPGIDLVGTKCVVSLQGQSHTRLKSFVSNAINRPDALRRIALNVQPSMITTFESWTQKGKIKLIDETRKLTFEHIGKLFVSFEPGPLLVMLDNLFDGLMKGLRANPINLPGTAYRHALQCRKKLDAIFRMELEKKKRINLSENRESDLMDGLMQIKDEEGNRLGDDEVIDNIVSLVVAGYESTAVTMMWAIYYLAKFPNVLQKLQEENLLISQNKKGKFITYEDVSKMEYTNKVVQETIRCGNISPFQFRTATKDIEYKGYKIPKNWNVMLWLRYLHTDPDNFEDPMCFNPERWSVTPKPGTFVAFGGGSRFCAGNMLAKIQIALFLHHLSIGYKWELLNPDIDIIYLSQPKPIDGVEIVFSKL